MDMIERVARAICYFMGETPDQPVIGMPCPVTPTGKMIVDTQWVAPCWTFYKGAAHAAIASMQEPTTGMIAAGSASHVDQKGNWNFQPWLVYRSMVDQALR